MKSLLYLLAAVAPLAVTATEGVIFYNDDTHAAEAAMAAGNPHTESRAALFKRFEAAMLSVNTTTHALEAESEPEHQFARRSSKHKKKHHDHHEHHDHAHHAHHKHAHKKDSHKNHPHKKHAHEEHAHKHHSHKHHAHHHSEHKKHSKKHAHAHAGHQKRHYQTVNGLQGSGVHPRLEIRTMEKEYPYMFNLFLLALEKYKHRVQSDPTSFYQVAGIHGVPNIPYAGVQQKSNGIGYCTHTSTLFPAWHRPYMALFEQAFHDCAVEVAHSFKGAKKAQYSKIAKTIRWPYWDWAIDPEAGQDVVPLSCVAKTVNLDTPSGRKTIVNPLYDYRYHPFNSDQFIEPPWNVWKTTLRHPSSMQSNAVTVTSALLQAMNAEQPNLKALVYNLFTQKMSWVQFANAATNGYNSLEAIHNIVHGTVGGSGSDPGIGHMTVLWYAAMDPIFFLHHGMVDHVLALWQRTHPDIWTTAQKATATTFTIVNGSIQGPNSPLTPFRRAKGGFWTSNSVRDWEEFGYTYPEFKSTKGTAADIRRIVNEKYGPSSSLHAAPGKRAENTTTTPGSTGSANVTTFGGVPSSGSSNSNSTLTPPIPTNLIPAITTSNGSFYEYTAHIIAPHNALNGSYSVYIFIGQPPSDVGDWSTAANMIGSNVIFASPAAGSMAAQLVTGSVSLTQSLTSKVSYGALDGLAVELVVPFLQNMLEWRVAQNGANIPASQVPGFKVSVISQELTPGASVYDFPTWGPENLLVNITHGKPGGLNIGEVMHDAGAFGGEIVNGLGEIGQGIANATEGVLGHL